MRRIRHPLVPELFLGLLSLAIAAVVVSYVVTGTVKSARRVQETISVTGSGRVPIEANLVRWSLSVATEAETAAVAAGRLRLQVGAVRDFLRREGVPARAVSADVVTNEEVVIHLPKRRRLVRHRVGQTLEVMTRDIDVVERVAPKVAELIESGVELSAQPLEYLSTELTQAKLEALAAATGEARRRGGILVRGLGGKLGRMRSSSLGVYQIVPRHSTAVSDYGINDTSTRRKEVVSVVSATFAVKR